MRMVCGRFRYSPRTSGELSPITFTCEPFKPDRGVVNTLLPDVSGFPLSTQDSNATCGRRNN